MNNRISVAIAPLRFEPSDRSEMVSQGLFGEELEVLEKQEKWSMIRMKQDGYEGWLDNKQWESFSASDEWVQVNLPLIQGNRSTTDLLWLPAGAKAPIAWITASNSVKWTGSFLDIEKCAMLFLNAPYLWGGRTVMGIDCSGFTQLVFRLNGISIPRDAYQQADIGTTVTFTEESQTGDLAFFDNAEGRIIHVGIILRDSDNGCRIIHASGKVRIDALDHQGVFHSEQLAYTHKLRIIKRILQ
jgi:cell wall-associated NlpC family hydrolase